MRDDKLLLTIAVFAVAIAVVSTGITYFSIINLTTKLTAYVTEATTNLTVETSAIVNFTNNAVNFSSGRVNSDSDAASLDTTGSGTVTGGNWTAQAGLTIENTGNVNISLNLSGTKTAATFIGGTSPVYEWNVTESEANTCLNQSGRVADAGDAHHGLELNNFHNVNTTATQSEKCRVFRFQSANDAMRIDFNLTIPEDSSTGELTDLITATVVANDPSTE
jgi:hypothetical protein